MASISLSAIEFPLIALFQTSDTPSEYRSAPAWVRVVGNSCGNLFSLSYFGLSCVWAFQNRSPAACYTMLGMLIEAKKNKHAYLWVHLDSADWSQKTYIYMQSKCSVSSSSSFPSHLPVHLNPDLEASCPSVLTLRSFLMPVEFLSLLKWLATAAVTQDNFIFPLSSGKCV